MAFPPQFLDEIRARTSLSEVIGKRVNLVRRGREHVALCPFHKEKTPSFTVNEDKGFFHCFGCGAHGDVIGFVMRADNLSFPEAIEHLARTAGLALPERRPEDRERAKQRASLYEVIEAACVWFEAGLAGGGGKAARDYLAGRDLEADAIAKFRLGWAPDSRHALKRALVAEGVPEGALVDAGLLIAPEGGGAPYDRFRGRIIFPIADRGGRVVGFGGRALGDGTPKYLNSPETPLFHKGALLYGHALAAAPARESGEAIVTEGYMDVIALHRAGFENAVAPLGTALTEIQIRELWRLAPEPVVCFDGDDAGRRAALRAVERSLPLLAPGRSLRFALLPPGEDPDSVIARRGKQALEEALTRARPLIDLLWEMEYAGQPTDTPERRAAIEKRLSEAVRRIADPGVRREYEREVKARLWRAFSDVRQGRARRPPGAGRSPPEPPLPDGLGSDPAGLGERRERLLIAMIVNHPALLDTVTEEFAKIEFADAELDRLRGAILEIAVLEPGLDSAALKNHLSTRGFSGVVDRLSGPLDWSERGLGDRLGKSEAPLSELEKRWRYASSRHSRLVTRRIELKAAEQALAENTTEENFARFEAIRRQIALGEREENDDFELTSGGDAP
ncbi:MAG: DNA primase [Alphaproteobacteria bacterium]